MTDKLEEYPLWAKPNPDWRPPSLSTPPVREPVMVKGSPRPGSRVMFRDAPRLPDAMPSFLPEDAADVEALTVSLRAMMGTDHSHDNAQTKAWGLALRTFVFAVVTGAVGFGIWAACAVFFDVGAEWLIVAFALAPIAAGSYMLASEATARRYSSAGVEILKVKTARQMHRDRLDSRERMHSEAAERWENIMREYLRTWGEVEGKQ